MSGVLVVPTHETIAFINERMMGSHPANGGEAFGRDQAFEFGRFDGESRDGVGLSSSWASGILARENPGLVAVATPGVLRPVDLPHCPG